MTKTLHQQQEEKRGHWEALFKTHLGNGKGGSITVNKHRKGSKGYTTYNQGKKLMMEA